MGWMIGGLYLLGAGFTAWLTYRRELRRSRKNWRPVSTEDVVDAWILAAFCSMVWPLTLVLIGLHSGTTLIAQQVAERENVRKSS